MNEKDCIMLQYLAEEQSLTKAAERLYITQPALSYRIQQLEKDFGVSIIVKSSKGTRLTPEGKYLVAYAKKTLTELNKMKDHIMSLRNEVKGTLRLGVASYYGLYKLPPILKRFKEFCPDVQFNVTSALSPEILELLHEEEIHVGVIRGDYPWFDARCLLHDEHIYMISKDDIDLDSLPDLPHIYYKEPRIKTMSSMQSPFSETIQAWWHERYNKPPTITMWVDSYETCKEMVKQGLGYSIVPGVFVSPQDGLKTTELIRKNGEPIKRNTWMIYRESTLELAFVDRFVEFMKAQYV
ncbi:LysR family transcriptional regulator [Paenibacillus chondroitinus]|uniref:LysR family transcriptional regulator n=1 Tax=Paenibacillus chondroitinus TaxID=59842 RepID=A0ABU6DDX3_9BACL|nr:MULTISPECIES: LysR family transcriptional regulator [Paenibacillus]MCY9657306.1 LysR family transcriptional regulator [Paenibacillus anseongense]MEB4795955.1 LysR family transcriptional regulator [Paenibacillus chondroitinus]